MGMEAIPITALTHPPVQLLSADSGLAHQFPQAASISSALLFNFRSSSKQQ
jgi:hypothetical protein